VANTAVEETDIKDLIIEIARRSAKVDAAQAESDSASNDYTQALIKDEAKKTRITIYVATGLYLLSLLVVKIIS